MKEAAASVVAATCVRTYVHVCVRACVRVISDLRAGMPGRQWTTTFKERSRKVTHKL